MTPPATDAKLRAAVAGPQRLDKETARDKDTHPVETLESFGLRDDATVVELTPYRGQWTAVLAPVLAEKGHLRLAVDRLTEGPKTQESLDQRIAKDEAHFGKPVTVMSNFGKCDVTLGPDGSADMVVSFRNMHDWMGAEVADRVVQAVHRVLKRGGIFALTDHRAKPGAATDPDTLSDPGGAYVPEDFMIAFVEKAGFRLSREVGDQREPEGHQRLPAGGAHAATLVRAR
ncbi:MAG TPA: methyltransferase domain-containing protein [Polyangiaceae bacterium]